MYNTHGVKLTFYTTVRKHPIKLPENKGIRSRVEQPYFVQARITPVEGSGELE